MKNITCFLLILAIFLFPALVSAGGGSNYKVTVSNGTQYTCRVKLTVTQDSGAKATAWRTLSPGLHTVFETGALCPCAIIGQVQDPKSGAWKATRTLNIALASQTDDKGQWCSSACFDRAWGLCRISGSSGGPIRDKDFTWCKE